MAWTIPIDDWYRGMIVITFKGKQGGKPWVVLKTEVPWA